MYIAIPIGKGTYFISLPSGNLLLSKLYKMYTFIIIKGRPAAAERMSYGWPIINYLRKPESGCFNNYKSFNNFKR